MTLPLIRVMSLGGTIAMTQQDGDGVTPTLTAEMLVNAVPGLTQIARVQALSFRQLPSAHLSYDDIESLAEAIRQAAADGVRGVVITQGTDTIEETAMLLDSLLSVSMPVIVTGAMRNPTVSGADGPANLLASVRVAAHESARGLGCLVVLNDTIHAARFVRKTHTSSPAAFQSSSVGALGWVSEAQVHLMFRPEGMPPVRCVETPEPRRVALLTITLGDDGALLRAALEAGFDGLVIQGLGGGHVPLPVAAALDAVKVPVVLASRAGEGEVLRNTYGFAGGEIDLQRRGVIRSGWLDGIKSKALLTLLLRHGHTHEEIAQRFRLYGGGRGCWQKILGPPPPPVSRRVYHAEDHFLLALGSHIRRYFCRVRRNGAAPSIFDVAFPCLLLNYDRRTVGSL